MKTYELKHIHVAIGLFNGSVYFEIDGRLLIINIGTPSFNDYNEWRLSELYISPGKYQPDGNDVELTPYADFPVITINQEELDFLDRYFATDNDWSDCPNSDSPFNYLFEPLLTSVFYENTDGLTHMLYKKGELTTDGYYENVPDREVMLKDWIDKKSLTEYHGMYNLLMPLMESIVAGYYKQRRPTIEQ